MATERPAAVESSAPRAAARDCLEGFHHSPDSSQEPHQGTNGGHAVDDSQEASHFACRAFAFVEKGLLDRFAPSSDRRGKNVGNMTAVLLASIERFVAIERAFANLQKKPFGKESWRNAATSEAQRAFKDD